jgi:hypothetical protein
MRLAPVGALAALLLTAGCVEKIAEYRVRAALIDAGLSERNSDCMAHRMVDRLTIRQLRKLEALKDNGHGQRRSLMDYVAAVERVGDSKVIAVTASSAALCATGLAR